VNVGGLRLLYERFVGGDARITSLGLHAPDTDCEPATVREPHGQPARPVIDERMPLPIFMWTRHASPLGLFRWPAGRRSLQYTRVGIEPVS
jgi:hypothetical protein